MMSGHIANPVLFNEKNKDWAFRTLASLPPASDNLSFLPSVIINFCVQLPHAKHFSQAQFWNALSEKSFDDEFTDIPKIFHQL